MRKLLSAMIVVFSMGMTGSVCAQDLEKGLKAYQANDYATSLKEWRFLAERGNAEAQRRVGELYNNGLGVVKNKKEAVKWWSKAAEGGDADAQWWLGLIYENGLVVLRDNVHAHMWYNIATSNGLVHSAQSRDRLERKMTAAEIDKAQDLALECVKKNYKGC